MIMVLVVIMIVEVVMMVVVIVMMVVMVVTMMMVVVMTVVVTVVFDSNAAIKCCLFHNVFGRHVARKNVMYTALSLLQCINCISQLLLFDLIVCYLE